MANRGLAIVRVTSDPQLIRHYVGSKVRLECNVSFTRLRELYQDARLVALPIRDGFSAAGQTAALEGLSCGQRVLISAGRSAEAVSHLNGVHVLPNADPELWLKMCMLLSEEDEPQAIVERVKSVTRNHSPKSVLCVLADAISEVDA